VGSIRHQPGGADRQPDAWCAAASGGGGGNPRLTWKQIQRRYASEGTFQETGIAPFDPCSIGVTRYRYRGARIPNPWTIEPTADPSARAHSAPAARNSCPSNASNRRLGGVQVAQRA
jgi:hypothetical protein